MIWRGTVTTSTWISTRTRPSAPSCSSCLSLSTRCLRGWPLACRPQTLRWLLSCVLFDSSLLSHCADLLRNLITFGFKGLQLKFKSCCLCRALSWDAKTKHLKNVKKYLLTLMKRQTCFFCGTQKYINVKSGLITEDRAAQCAKTSNNDFTNMWPSLWNPA